MRTASTDRQWDFFRAGGVDQVKLSSAADIMALDQLDQKLWMALSCPTTGLFLDSRTLELIDDNKDGRVRAPEIIAAAKWACSVLKNPDELLKKGETLPLRSIDESTDEGKNLLAAAKRILAKLDKADAEEITVEDATNTTDIFADTRFNGDGIITATAAEDPELETLLEQIIECMESVEDRSGKPGVNEEKVNAFFEAAEAYVAWHAKSDEDEAILVAGEGTSAAAAAVAAVRDKVDDFFARCRLAAFDARAIEALNREESEYLALAAKDLKVTAEEIASFPLARIEANKALPLGASINPAWSAAVEALAKDAIEPLLGKQTELTEAQWAELCGKLAAYDAWTADKAGAAVEKLGIERVREILASEAKDAIIALIAQDKELEAEANAITSVEKLVRYRRDLFTLLVNYVSFERFYRAEDKAIFQAGTLYLDRRSCDLCIRVEDTAKHSAMANPSRCLLAYCDLERKATNEKMTIVAAFTSGDSGFLFVGRHGIFYDRDGNDWDATIVKIISNPVSIPEAVWSPYKKFFALIEAQVEKFAASKDKALQDQAAAAAAKAPAAVAAPAAPGKPAAAGAAPAKSPFDVAKFVGIFAAIGLAIGAIGGVLVAIFSAFFKLAWWQMPLALLGVMVVISTPSVIIAWLKLRQRNLGPLLDANGWAVNSRAKVNIPFGASMTQVAKLPKGASRDTRDPFKPPSTARRVVTLLIILAASAFGAWYFGAVEAYFPGLLPKSGWMKAREAKKKAAKAAADKAAADKAAKAKAAAKAAADQATAAKAAAAKAAAAKAAADKLAAEKAAAAKAAADKAAAAAKAADKAGSAAKPKPAAP
ncbi:MAG: hypothetical protein KC503_46460 [Myxococcales bacterium]|nr:hypothetical protein [Myxococcales bacterium]